MNPAKKYKNQTLEEVILHSFKDVIMSQSDRRKFKTELLIKHTYLVCSLK